MMAAEIQVEPAYYNWHGTISAHRYEEKRCVLQMPLVMYGDQDAKSGSDDTDGNEREGEAVLDPVWYERNKHSKNKGTCPRGDAVELCACWGVAVALDYAGCEECVPRTIRRATFSE